jgi:hypothetical protein
VRSPRATRIELDPYAQPSGADESGTITTDPFSCSSSSKICSRERALSVIATIRDPIRLVALLARRANRFDVAFLRSPCTSRCDADPGRVLGLRERDHSQEGRLEPAVIA